MDGILLGGGNGGPTVLPLARGNRHGLIAGATGTGKTVTLQALVEGFSAAGVPSFVADVKGDLAGLAMPGSPTARHHDAFAARAAQIGLTDWRYEATPAQLWDVYGTGGHPVRTTIGEIGPLLLGRLLGLTDVQQGVLEIAFHIADAEGLLLLDLDDLDAMMREIAGRASELTVTHGNVSKASVGAIQRALLQLRGGGGAALFGEPALALSDLIATAPAGRGIVNILAADRLVTAPRLYAAFLLWLLSELFETLPEVGDVDRPRFVLVLDEAHLLFDDANPALIDKVEQVVRLIRSKGVGVFLVTQNPADIPDVVLGQLGNRIQHRLAAYTPREMSAVRAAADGFRPNPGVDVRAAITELSVGEALVSVIGEDGAPTPVERVRIRPPAGRVGPLAAAERAALIASDAIGDRYDTLVDRESAAELLGAKADAAATAAASAKAAKVTDEAAAKARREAADSPWNRAVASATRSASSAVGRTIANEITGAVLGRGRGRRGASGGMLGGIVRGVLGGLFRG